MRFPSIVTAALLASVMVPSYAVAQRIKRT
jgi:hypothetical protein